MLRGVTHIHRCRPYASTSSPKIEALMLRSHVQIAGVCQANVSERSEHQRDSISDVKVLNEP